LIKICRLTLRLDMRQIVITSFFVGFLLVGCSSNFNEYRVDENGQMTKVGSFTGDELWKRLVDESISKELAGEKPEAGSSTWKDYWRGWYADIRLHPKPAWKPSDFKTSKDMVTYIKQQRAAKGLPTYE